MDVRVTLTSSTLVFVSQTLIAMLSVCYLRKNRVVFSYSPPFVLISMTSIILTLVATVLLIIPADAIVCSVSTWLFNVGITLCFGSVRRTRAERWIRVVQRIMHASAIILIHAYARPSPLDLHQNLPSLPHLREPDPAHHHHQQQRSTHIPHMYARDRYHHAVCVAECGTV